MQQRKNPLLIVLGICGGCVLIGVIAVVIMGYMGYNKGKDLFSGTVQMATSMPKFMTDLQSKNYSAAASLADPAAPDALTASKLQKMEEAMEKKLGPMQGFSQQPSGQNQNTTTDPRTGQPKGMEFIYSYKVNYKKGTATATFDFKSEDYLHPSGRITSFKLEPDKE